MARLDAAQGLLQRLPDVGRHRSHIAPMATFWNLEAVVLGKAGVFFVAAGLLQGRLVLLVVNVREALEEQEREDVGLEVRRIHRTAQDVRGLPEVGFKLIEGDGVRGHAAVPNGLCTGMTNIQARWAWRL